jgi:hypothetical protein
MNVVTIGSMITVAMGTELSKVAIGRVTVIGGGAGVGDDGVGVGVGDGVAIGVGVGVGDGVAGGVGVGVVVGVGPGPVIVIRPLGVKSASCALNGGAVMKIRESGAGCQTNGLVAPDVLLTLTILRLNNVPDPFIGSWGSERADMRRVFSVPGPVLRMSALTFQLVAVSPAAATRGFAKLTIAESKVKSPWKPA